MSQVTESFWVCEVSHNKDMRASLAVEYRLLLEARLWSHAVVINIQTTFLQWVKLEAELVHRNINHIIPYFDTQEYNECNQYISIITISIKYKYSIMLYIGFSLGVK